MPLTVGLSPLEFESGRDGDAVSMTLLDKMARRGPADLFAVTEAAVLLTFFRVSLAAVPVQRIIRRITHGRARDVDAEHLARRVEGRELEDVRRVMWAVSAITRHSAVKFVCLPQALAGYTMLRRRKIASTITYGVMRSAEGELLAHTWLMVGDATLFGAEAAEGFVEVERWA